ncbi:MAG TPA: hypothetical protein VHV82_00460 [Sporichthyaceae bacterium]|jgi:hypothetical protein|nr:hypothetical protein [Sporichthyaceae bacterium]
MRLLLAGVLAILLLISAGAVTRHSGGRAAALGSRAAVDEASVTRAEGRQDTVAQMLARRATALQSKDRTAFLDTVDDADPEFRDSQVEWFDNLSAVPFDAWSFKLTDGLSGGVPPAATALTAKLADGSFPYIVAVSYRITGYDNAPQHYEQVLTFTPRHGRWLVSGSFDPTGQAPHRELWDVGKVQLLAADHGLVLGLVPPDALRIYAAEVDREVPLVDAVWKHPWSRQVLIEVTRTEDEMATLLGGAPSAYRQLAAVTRGELGTVEATSAAERIIVNPKAFGELSEVGRRVIMGHEITHVAVRASTQSWTPRWLAEGLADYVGYRDSGLSTEVIAQELAADVRRGRVPDALPVDDAFAATDSDLAQAYEMSWLACRMIAERYGGPDTLIAFYRAVGSAGGANQIEKAFGEVLSTSRQQFTGQWREYVKSELG